MPRGIQYLDGPRLRRCLIAGLGTLANERDYLNRINVFPVPDGDTGNNLAQTALGGLRELEAQTSNSASAVLNALAIATLDNAQGNSGALLAQFLQGLADTSAALERLDTQQLADMFLAAGKYTRSALESPREGTIVTAIDAAAAAANAARDCDDFAVLLPAMLDATREAVAASTGQLEELRRANVVDAGAAGFCAILEGCTDFLLTGSIRDLPSTPVPTDVRDVHQHQLADLRFRYCTECMLSGEKIDAAHIRKLLQPEGDSLVIAGSSRRLRIHIHTNDPERVFDLVAEFGEPQHTKADDMIGQARSLSRADRKVAVVTDSAADIPDSILAELDIHMIPLRVLFGTESHLDKIGMSPQEFRDELARNPEAPGTSQPTQGDLRRTYEFLTTHYSQVIAIHVSGALSGTFQAAKSAAASATNGERIRVIDSRNVSVGQGLIVKRAAQFAAAGMEGDELEAAVQKEVAGVRTFALVSDLSNAVRSGRVRPSLRRIADWLRLTPILTNTPAGKVGVYRFLPGRFRLVERFAKSITDAMGTNGSWELALVHGGSDPESANRLEAILGENFSHVAETFHTEIGPALGVHAGMDALVVALRRVDAELDHTPAR